MSALKSILVTGGTGSFGQAFVRAVLARFPDVERVAIYSRDELKQFEMAQRPAMPHTRSVPSQFSVTLEAT